MQAMQLERDAQHGADVVRNIVADDAIAARGPIFKMALLVHQCHGDAVDLQLDHPLDRFAGQQLRDTGPVLAQFFDAVVLSIESIDRGCSICASDSIG